MNQRALVSVEVQKGDHTFSFHMPLGAKWSDAYDASREIFEGLAAHIKQLEEQEKEKQALDPVEVVAEVV